MVKLIELCSSVFLHNSYEYGGLYCIEATYYVTDGPGGIADGHWENSAIIPQTIAPGYVK